MMYLDAPPRLIETKVFSAMPDDYRRKGVRTDWADANRPGQPTDCFIEGPSFDADYMHGIMELDVKKGRMQPVLTARNSESFKGCNDLHIASNGDIYFTDQGQTGLHDPTGRVYRLPRGGGAACPSHTPPS